MCINFFILINQFVCSYLFYPATFLMGVDEQDCRRVAQLIGYKIFTNEFVAYIHMGELLENRKTFWNYTSVFGADAPVIHDGLDIVLPRWNNTVLEGGFLSVGVSALSLPQSAFGTSRKDP